VSTVIKVENLSKQYRLGNVGTGSIAHDVNRAWYRIRGKEDPYLKIGEENDRSKKGSSEYVWALRDINFDVKQGEVLGIIGRNGAGKSTLLKILSRTTSPTTGSIKIKGRVASLLEVGTGFHPELTGRENIFLNGAILGMTKKEIKSKFDEIVDFAGVERYIDTPVKRYSSGMYVRLAFGVAAHLEPEILIVDEVLAVGDAEFQKKALGKMKDVSAKDGRTVLFVSHNMQAITALTNLLLILDNGRKFFEGDTNLGIKKYLELGANKTDFIYQKDISGKQPKVVKAEVVTSQNNNVHVYGQPLSINFEIFCPVSINEPVFSFQIVNSSNVKVVHVLNANYENNFCQGTGLHKFSCYFPKLSLYPDDYTLILHLSDHVTKTKFETIEGICPFEVQVLGELREYYWKRNEAVYLEESKWILNND
jgi:lipopolysaccharide transport system ATP-binding protein